MKYSEIKMGWWAISSRPLTNEFILELHQQAIEKSFWHRNSRLVREWLFLPGTVDNWLIVDEILSRRDPAMWDQYPAHWQCAMQEIRRRVIETIGWSNPVFHPDDEVGVLLWDPRDCLAGVEVVLELEDHFKLKTGELDCDDWARRPLRELVSYLAESEVRVDASK